MRPVQEHKRRTFTCANPKVRQTVRAGKETDRAGNDLMDFSDGPPMLRPTGIWPGVPDNTYTSALWCTSSVIINILKCIVFVVKITSAL